MSGLDKGKLTAGDRTSAFDRLAFSTELAPAVADADLVIEAVIEKLDVKRALFADLHELCPSHTILASNSSSLMPSQLAGATGRPDRVVNLHFFNPALIMRCVEVVRGPEKSDQTSTGPAERPSATRWGRSSSWISLASTSATT